MKFVIDENKVLFVGDQIIVDCLGEALVKAKVLSSESNNLFVVSGYDQDPSHIFMDGVCYKRENFPALTLAV